MRSASLKACPREYRSLGILRWPRGASPGPPRLASLAEPFAPLHVARRNFLFYHRLIRSCKPNSEPRMPQGIRQPNKVENTGLEPVTSWLQTRRSPS
jgi:hypothetical protein